MKNLNLELEHGGGFMIDFEGERAQVALVSPTRWSYPDDGKSARLRAFAYGDVAQLFLAAPKLRAALLRAAAEIREMGCTCSSDRLRKPGHARDCAGSKTAARYERIAK